RAILCGMKRQGLAPNLFAVEVISQKAVGTKINVDALAVGCRGGSGRAAEGGDFLKLVSRSDLLPKQFAIAPPDRHDHQLFILNPRQENVIIPNDRRGMPWRQGAFPKQFGGWAKLNGRFVHLGYARSIGPAEARPAGGRWRWVCQRYNQQ